MSRADRFTGTDKQLTYYSDFPINFDLNPVTGLLSVVKNEEAVKHRIRNLILTNLTERPYHPQIGSKIRSALFDPVDPITEDIIRTSIRHTIKNCEPAAILRDVVVNSYADMNAYEVTIYFETINIVGKVFEVNLILRRIH